MFAKNESKILDLSPVLSSSMGRWVIKSNLNSPGQSRGNEGVGVELELTY